MNTPNQSNQSNQNNPNNQSNPPLNPKQSRTSASQLVYELDNRINYVAMYTQTKGLTQTIDFNAIAKLFTEYKQLLTRGVFTIDQLENNILIKYSAFPDSIKKAYLNPQGIDINNVFPEIPEVIKE